MYPIARIALGAATAAVLAVTAVAPSGAAADTPPGGSPGKRPVVGSGAAAKDGKQVTVTLVTGDKVLVTTDPSGHSSAAVLPRKDGVQPIVQTYQRGKDLYVYPDDASRAIAEGKVDEQLFNVSGLIRQGYDDTHSDTLPLIATYRNSVNVADSAPAAPRGAERGLSLPAVDGVALKADKDTAATFWQDVTDNRSRSGSSLKKLWLDSKVKATLAQSTKQVHAPEAWAEGYDGKGTKVAVLDTGVDAQHPDLVNRVAASKNFTDSSTTDDRHGHGTHTASTVGGSGAASDGREKGVAPGTSLLIGKVLNDSGSGDSSWIIAGMQWAVDQKADVVSMSLGNPAIGDCTDPLAEAAKQLSQNTHTLFVIAAGNTGSATETVSSPGCAPGVLTVGAVDHDDTTAPFSSRGPVAVTHTLKPEISAPGVDILAAKAGGRGVYAYQTMSGTSMATPHVAGAAAIVRQAHPDWTAQQIKAALVSSARTGGKIAGADQTGAGVLDVATAVHQKVLSAPAVQGGSFNWPQDASDRTTVQVPFTNTSTGDLTLGLKVSGVHGNDGSDVNSGVVKLDQSKVTVPAGATVQVPVRINPTAHLQAGQYGAVTGRIMATGSDVHVSVPVTLYVQPETVTLRVKVIDRNGQPANGASSLDLVSLDTAKGERRTNQGATDQTYSVRPGDYALSSFVATYDANKVAQSIGYLGRPQLRITGDTTVVLDARKAHRLSVHTDRPSTLNTTSLSYARTWDNAWELSGSLSAGSAVQKFYASVDGRAKKGYFEFRPTWRATGSQNGSSYVYNLTFPTQGPLQSDHVYQVKDSKLAQVTEKWNALGAEADYIDALYVLPVWDRSTAIAVGVFNPVHVPGTRTAYYTTGDDVWSHGAMTSFPFAAFMNDQNRTYRAGDRRSEEWYHGLLRPAAPRDTDGKPVLAAERQGEQIGFQSALWLDASGDHWSGGAGFGDLGNLVLKRNGEQIATSEYPYDAFTVPAEDSAYELTQNLEKIPSSDRNWLRSTGVTTTWSFRSHLESDVYSRGLPILFPDYDLPVDGMNTLPAKSGIKVGLSVEGHAGYTPGTITAASLSYSYDGGTTWTQAPTEQKNGKWTAVLDHTGAAGKQVTLKTTFTDSNKNAVSQTITRAYDVR
ncbi:S8 family serine peptidase [Streptomyces sp. NBC_01387]|uniref:S8 family peptidase n=1 Tax=unclassified Streptomyces TaxID=2593676 RepID=UPI00225ADA4A|nr:MULTISPECIES: S8 family serine peptidase [unclassified Streptomyces]MCX4551434.1 S8 family serine peptidase [Streptomyces sp. NBC_01500]